MMERRRFKSEYRVLPYGLRKWAVQFRGETWLSLADDDRKQWIFARDRNEYHDGPREWETREDAEQYCRECMQSEAGHNEQLDVAEAWESSAQPVEVPHP